MNLGETIELGYELLQHVGQDSLGEVYEARNRQTKRVVRVTMLRTELSEAKEAAPDFLRDALEAATIVRSRVLPVIDLAWMSDNRPVLMSEMVSGRTAAEVLAHEGPLGPERVATMGVELCHGLAATHARGLFHGALGTDSLLLEPQDDGAEHLRIIDFGLRHLLAATSPVGTASRRRFRAPELDEGEPVDGRADLFSVGVILYELLTGLAPTNSTTSDGPSLFDPEPLPLVRPDLTHEMAELIDQAMAPDPADRLLGVEAMARELAAFASRGFSDLPPPPRPSSLGTDPFAPETSEGQTVPMSPDVFRSMFSSPPSRPSAMTPADDDDGDEPLGQPLRVHPPRLDAPDADELDEDNERPTPSEPAIVAALASATLRPSPEPEGPPPPSEPPVEASDEEPTETRATSSTPPAAEVDASDQGGRFLIPAIAGALAVLVAIATSALVLADRQQGEAAETDERAEESAIVIDLDDLDDVREVESIAVAEPSAPRAGATTASAEIDAALAERADGGELDGGATDDTVGEAMADAAAERSEGDGNPSGGGTTLASAGDGGAELTTEQVEERLERASRYLHMGQPLSCLMFTEGLPRSVEVDSQRVRCLTANRQYNRACRVARRHPDDPWCERWIRHNCRGR